MNTDAEAVQIQTASTADSLREVHGSAASQERHSLQTFANTSLKAAAGFWFLVAVAGQWMFAYYVVGFYGGAAMEGNLAAWNEVLPHGYIPGDTAGNAAVAMHLLFAAIIIVGGPLQLIPQIRAHAPTFHRWNGRLFLPTAVAASIAGLYMTWTRGTDENFVRHMGISLDALLIMGFAAMALRYALARDIKTHRRWALRLFLVVNGVWFFRVGVMLWIFLGLHESAFGFDAEAFTGPFLDFLSFADYLLPLAVLEIYLRVKDRGSASSRIAMATTLVALTGAMGIGIFVATMGLWLPHL